MKLVFLIKASPATAMMRSLCCVLMVAMFAIGARAERLTRALHAVRSAAPGIDGILEAEWLRGGLADQFTQKQPVENKPVSLPTYAYVLYDDHALYVAFDCRDTAPDSIKGRIQRRDSDGGSDYVDVYLDPFHDHRNGYWFTVTAGGVQSDGTVADESEFDDSWDGIWESAVARHDSGWVAEIRIPFSTLRHGGARPDGWGINFARIIERRQEKAYWQPVSREQGFRVSEMGHLLGLENIARLNHLVCLPHALGRWDAPAGRDWHSANEWENLGLFVKWVPTATWVLDLAYQPDFAQVDVDQEVVNLSNYPVFLVEKRPFFLEAKQIFDTAPIQQLYTRRITDPDLGGRLNYQTTNLRASVLAGRSRSKTNVLQDVAAARILGGIGQLNTLGFTSTYLSEPGFHAATVGADTRIRWGNVNRLSIGAAGVERSGYDVHPFEARASILQDLKFTRAQLTLLYRGRDYNINDLGWGDVSNTLRQALWIGKDYYPQRTLFQSIGYNVNLSRYTLPDGRLPELGSSFEVTARTRENLHLLMGATWGVEEHRRYQVFTGIAGPFRDNFYEDYGTFDTRRHPFTTRWFGLYSDSRRPFELNVWGLDGTLYDGRRWGIDPELTLKPRANLELAAGLQWRQLWGVTDIDSGRFRNFRIHRFRVRYSPALDVSLRGTVQWIEDERNLLTNLLLAWNWKSGSWFYLVYDEANRPSRPVAYRKPGDRTLRLKWSYYFTAAL